MPDWKNIGLAGKDVLLGVVTVAAGATGGQAGAQGAQQIDRGLDGILGMAGVRGDAPPNRINPEQSDFAVRQTAQSPHAASAVKRAEAPIFRESVVDPPAPVSQSPSAIPSAVVEELSRLGYGESEIAEIAAGRFRPASAGQTVRSAEPQRSAQAEGLTKRSAEPTPSAGFEGFSIGSVLGALKGLGS